MFSKAKSWNLLEFSVASLLSVLDSQIVNWIIYLFIYLFF